MITDPPYDAHTARNFSTKANKPNRVPNISRKQPIEFGSLDSLDWLDVWLPRVRRWSLVWCAIEQVGSYRDQCPDLYVRGCFWDRTNGAPQFSGDRPATAGEACAVFHAPGRKYWSGRGRRGFWSGPRNLEGGIGHPTPKPLWLMQSQIELFTDPGDVIVDPFMGSGTTAIACIGLGRKFIGIEIDNKYFDIACDRIDQAQRQGRLIL